MRRSGGEFANDTGVAEASAAHGVDTEALKDLVVVLAKKGGGGGGPRAAGGRNHRQ